MKTPNNFSKFGIESSKGHLDYFYKKYKNELDEFVAEFELVPDQVGAIIYIDGHIVGIEKAPNKDYWKQIWQPLVRDSYGCLAMNVAVVKNKISNFRVPMDEGCTTLDDIKKSLTDVNEKLQENINKSIRELLDDTFKTNTDDNNGDFEVLDLFNDQFGGQIVKKDDGSIVYVSIATKKKFLQSDWYKAKEFSI